VCARGTVVDPARLLGVIWQAEESAQTPKTHGHFSCRRVRFCLQRITVESTDPKGHTACTVRREREREETPLSCFAFRDSTNSTRRRRGEFRSPEARRFSRGCCALGCFHSQSPGIVALFANGGLRINESRGFGRHRYDPTMRERVFTNAIRPLIRCYGAVVRSDSS